MSYSSRPCRHNRLTTATRLILISAIFGTAGCLFKTPVDPEIAPARYFVHTIKNPGETLGTISHWYTGTPAHWREIERATPGLRATNLQIGQRVNIPELLVKYHKPMPPDFVMKPSRDGTTVKGTRSTTPVAADAPEPAPAVKTIANEKDRLLFDAIMFADAGRVRELITSGADPNSGQEGRSFLGWAAQNGSPDVVKILLENGAALNITDTRGYSALMYAASSNQIATVQTLLQAKADANVAAHDGKTALHLAIEHANQEMVRALIMAGANPMRANGNELSPLLTAIQNDSIELVKILLSARADINSSRGNYTPLSYAAARENVAMINALIEAGADVNLAADKGDKPVFEALSSVAALRALFSAGASANVRNQKGETPLAIAIQRGTKAELATILAAGADVNMKTSSGQSPLALAESLGENEIAELLKKNGAR